MKLIWSGFKKDFEKSEIEKEFKKVLEKNGVLEKVEVGLSLITEAEIRELNKKYLKKDKVTDVLSFPIEDEVGPNGVRMLGDIVICEKYLSQAKKLLVHGLLHLLGIHHD